MFNKFLTAKFAMIAALGSLWLAISDRGYAEGNEFYRYKNAKGVTVIDGQIPPELAPNGYDVISKSGQLIRRVPRQLSGEELRLANTDEARARLKEQEEARNREWDESLMLRYSDVADIEAARDRSVRDLQIRISILRSNLSSLKAQIEREQARAADIERRGSTVPPAIKDAIDKMRAEIGDTEEAIALRQKEVEESRQAYQRDIDRFKTLEEKLQLRREYSSKTAE